MRLSERSAAYFQNELKRFFETDIDLIDVRTDGCSLETDWYFRFDLGSRRGIIAVDKNGRFEGMVGDLVGDEYNCIWTNKKLCGSTNTKLVGSTAKQQEIVAMVSQAL